MRVEKGTKLRNRRRLGFARGSHLSGESRESYLNGLIEQAARHQLGKGMMAVVGPVGLTGGILLPRAALSPVGQEIDPCMPMFKKCKRRKSKTVMVGNKETARG